MSLHDRYWSRLDPIIAGEGDVLPTGEDADDVRKRDQQTAEAKLKASTDVFFGYALFTPPKPPLFFASDKLEDVASWYGTVTMFPDVERAAYFKDKEPQEEFKGPVWAGILTVTTSADEAPHRPSFGGVLIGIGAGIVGLIIGGRAKKKPV